jgi:hypothetical protein
MNLTATDNTTKLLPTAPHWAVGFERPKVQGAEVMRQQVHSFFLCLPVMVGVCGGFAACRFLDPVFQPYTSAALRLKAPVGGLSHSQGVSK